jgi:outer membrane lipoprotein-sorting protein
MSKCLHLRFSIKCLLVVGFVSLMYTGGYAQHPGYTPVEDIPSFKKQFNQESIKVLSITSEFTQEKTLTALTEKITSKGKFWYKRSNKVRLEYTKPFAYLVIMNGDKILVRDHQKENRINAKSNKLFQQVNRIMIDCVQGTILESRDFTTRVFENENALLLEMTPVSKTLKEFFKTIILTVDKKDYSAKSILMNEPMGDITLISFDHKKLNEQIADKVFAP